MEKRTTEGHMDWEYQGGIGPVDENSPFVKLGSHPMSQAASPAKSIFATPMRSNGSIFGDTPNPFAPSATSSHPPSSSSPSKALQPLGQFTHQLNAVNAPPFRNPAFTTPRRPLNESIYSETETSPSIMSSAMMDKTSDVEMATPEADRTDDSFATITPTKVDKNYRYMKSGCRPGRGEIPRAHKGFSQDEVIRRRARQVLDRDQGGSRYRLGRLVDSSDYESEDDQSIASPIHEDFQRKKRSREQNKATKAGLMGRLLKAMEEHPNAPENLYKWIQVCFNVAIFSGVMMFSWKIIGAIKSDLDKANAAARANSINEVQECTTNYIENRCGQAGGPVPYLRDRCAEWDICMQRDVDAVMSIRVVIREIAEIVNEFSSTMQFRSWLLVGGLLFVAICAANMSLFRNLQPRSSPTTSAPQASAPPQTPFGGHPDPSQGYMYVPLQTPSTRRHMAIMDDGSETDEPRSIRPQRMHALMAAPHTPSSSGRRTQFKSEFRSDYRDRSMSPSKRSPTKMMNSYR